MYSDIIHWWQKKNTIYANDDPSKRKSSELINQGVYISNTVEVEYSLWLDGSWFYSY